MKSIDLIDLTSEEPILPDENNVIDVENDVIDVENDVIDITTNEKRTRKNHRGVKRKIDEVYCTIDLTDYASDKEQEASMSEKKRGKQRVNSYFELDSTEHLQKGDCTICFEETMLFPLEHSCKHKYCLDCLKHYCEDKITSHTVPIKCPLPSCKQDMHQSDLKRFLPSDMIDNYEKYLLESILENNPEEFSCCLTPDCGLIFAYNRKTDNPDFFCKKCFKRYCMRCQVEYHEGISCRKYQRWKKDNDSTETKFMDYITNSGSKQCPKCKRYIQKKDGCNHITCKCGNEFCYHCGQNYPKCQCSHNPHMLQIPLQIEARSRRRQNVKSTVSITIPTIQPSAPILFPPLPNNNIVAAVPPRWQHFHLPSLIPDNKLPNNNNVTDVPPQWEQIHLAPLIPDNKAPSSSQSNTDLTDTDIFFNWEDEM